MTVINLLLWEKETNTVVKSAKRLTRRVPLVEQDLFCLLEHMRSLPVFSENRAAQYIVFSVNHCLYIAVSVLFRFSASVLPLGISKLYIRIQTIN
jgi:hypothetical protein